MSLRVARDVILQQEFDSAALTPLCCLVHSVKEQGLYIGEVARGKETVGTFRVQAVGDGAAHQANIDLALVRGSQHDSRLVLAGGALVFHCSSGTAGYSVKVWRNQGGRRKVEFDSRKLGADDLFTVTLLHPGDWEVVGEDDRLLCRLDVGPCKPGRKPYRAPSPVMTGLDEASIEGAGVGKLKQAQTQVFKAEGRTRIRVRLTEASRVAAAPGPDKVQWRRES